MAVFHPDHEPLHGITVVVTGASGRTWVGRYHETTERGVVLRDVAMHDPATALLTRGDWVERLRKFGIRVEERIVTLPATEAGPMVPFAEWTEPAAHGTTSQA